MTFGFGWQPRVHVGGLHERPERQSAVLCCQPSGGHGLRATLVTFPSAA